MSNRARVLSEIVYSNGDRQVVLEGSHPELGDVVTYSDGLSETTVSIQH